MNTKPKLLWIGDIVAKTGFARVTENVLPFIKDDFDNFHESIKEVLVAVLCSPNFIYLFETENQELEETSNQHYLASRLSYFLWNSPPDKALTSLANKGRLQKKLSDQIDRMINSCLLYTSPSPRDVEESRMPSSA